ncbi:hypothetical protein [Cedecea davisae]|uniref:hypothetical protein n=1 Tax=Cedecea davisae TaxID=158484 RepID=UPI00242FCE96|nr:hypothetical protein [Cedecea davisae]
MRMYHSDVFRSHSIRGTLSGLWSEWGDLFQYSGTGFASYGNWSSEQASSGKHYLVTLYQGYAGSNYDTYTFCVVCRQGF